MENERYFLLAFIADGGATLSLDSLPTWGNNVPGVAVVQRCIGVTPESKTLIRGVCLQRVETRPTTNRRGSVYVAVICASYQRDLLLSHDMWRLKVALQQLKEVYLIWNRVPSCWMNCFACNKTIFSPGPVFFENGDPVCSTFCTLLNKQL